MKNKCLLNEDTLSKLIIEELFFVIATYASIPYNLKCISVENSHVIKFMIKIDLMWKVLSTQRNILLINTQKPTKTQVKMMC